MSWYTYKQVLLPNGNVGYERVPVDLQTALAGTALLPELSPAIKAGEVAGSPSIVELLKEKNRLAAYRRLVRDNTPSSPNESKPPVSPYRRVIEP